MRPRQVSKSRFRWYCIFNLSGLYTVHDLLRNVIVSPLIKKSLVFIDQERSLRCKFVRFSRRKKFAFCSCRFLCREMSEVYTVVSNELCASVFRVDELCPIYRKPLLPKRWYPLTGLYGVKSKAISIWINTVFTDPAIGFCSISDNSRPLLFFTYSFCQF
jgi:hypothetical protein